MIPALEMQSRSDTEHEPIDGSLDVQVPVGFSASRRVSRRLMPEQP